MMSKIFQPRSQRAVILILTFWISIILAIMAYSTAFELRLNLRMTSSSQDLLKARAIARVGLAKAVIDLKNDRLLSIAETSIFGSDSYLDVWGQPDDKTDIEFGGGKYSVSVEDESGKFNINLLNEMNIYVLATVLEDVGGLEDIDSVTVARMILDYQDSDFFPVAGRGRNESNYYTDWAYNNFSNEIPAGWVFKPKNDMIISLNELVQLPGITAEMMWGNLASRRQESEMDWFERRENSSALANYITVRADHRLNINTVPPVILKGILRMTQPLGIGAEELAQEIDEYRNQLMRLEGEESAIRNLNELAAVGLTDRDTQAMNTVYPLWPQSRYFTLTSKAEYKGVSKTIVARVSITSDSFQIDVNNPETTGTRDTRARGRLSSRASHALDPSVRVVEMQEF